MLLFFRLPNAIPSVYIISSTIQASLPRLPFNQSSSFKSCSSPFLFRHFHYACLLLFCTYVRTCARSMQPSRICWHSPVNILSTIPLRWTFLLAKQFFRCEHTRTYIEKVRATFSQDAIVLRCVKILWSGRVPFTIRQCVYLEFSAQNYHASMQPRVTLSLCPPTYIFTPFLSTIFFWVFEVFDALPFFIFSFRRKIAVCVAMMVLCKHGGFTCFEFGARSVFSRMRLFYSRRFQVISHCTKTMMFLFVFKFVKV